MVAISTDETGRIDSGYGNCIVTRVKQVQRFSDGEPEVQGFYPTKKFLKRSEMMYYRKIK